MSPVDAALRDKLMWERWVRLTPNGRKSLVAELARQLADAFELRGMTDPEHGVSVPVFRERHTGLLLHLVPGGTFRMGLSDGELEALRCQLDGLEAERKYAAQYDSFEDWSQGLREGLAALGDAAAMRPAHEVRLQPFLLARRPLSEHEVGAILAGEPIGAPTVEPGESADPEELLAGMDGEDEDDLGDEEEEDLPGWLEPERVPALLSALGAHGLRLPSEAEWEHACRAGTTTPFPWGESVPERPTGEPNALGFLDFGYSPELCADRWCPDHQGALADGAPRLEGQGTRVARGGAGVLTPWQGCGEWLALLSAHREPEEQNEGYHVIRPLAPL
jgi:hypothetical protein